MGSNTKTIMQSSIGIVLAIFSCITFGVPPVPSNIDPLLHRTPSEKALFIHEYGNDDEEVFTLPEIPKVPTQDQVTSSSAIYIKGYTFNGNTVFSDLELQALCTDYINRKVSFSELQELRQKLTLHYINHGYVNSGLLLEDQKIVDRTIQFKVIEGKISDFLISGTKSLNPQYISKRLARTITTPFQVAQTHESLLVLRQDPNIASLAAEIAPGDRKGEASLLINVEEREPLSWSLVADNHRSPSIGSYHAQTSFSYRNLTGWGDQIFGSYSLSQGMDDYSIGYSIPIHPNDTVFHTSYQQSASIVIEPPFDIAEIENHSEQLQVGITYPAFKRAATKLMLGITIEHKKTETYLLGLPFSFSAGTVDGVSKVTNLQLSQEWQKRGRESSIALRSNFYFGLDQYNSTVSITGAPDSKYRKWVGQLQYARRIKSDHQLLVRGSYQWANEALLSSEKYSIGGADTVRGYRENQMVADKAGYISLEYRHLVTRHGFPGQGQLYLAPFADYGWVSSISGANPEPDHISSIGIGLLYDYQNFFAHIYLAHATYTFSQNEHDLQDDGIHFSFGYRS